MTDARLAADIESSVELLRTIASVLDIRDVFPRVSEIANKMLPHDLLTMMFDDGGGQILIEAASTDEFRGLGRFTKADDSEPKEGFVIIDDFTTASLPIVEPVDMRERIVGAGFRSLLVVLARVRHQKMGLGFWSKTAGAFSRDDVQVARRVADHVALAVSHEQLAEAARQIAEAHARAERLEARVQSLARELESRPEVRVVGRSPEWKDVLKKAAQVAETETTVLVSGESGTGKEVVARFIHRASARKGGPFVALNCAALPEQLLESELFGYERGALTGAQQAKPGQIELAGGGVLFLDEVSEMTPSAQAKFLRVLQEREFQRLGGTRMLKADVRVIAATNRDLKVAMTGGAFREDLYYRLHVFAIHLPPLRERKEDILPLLEHFVTELGPVVLGRPAAGISREAREHFLAYAWPGNVRELRNAVERALILCEGGLINPEHLPWHAESTKTAPAPLPAAPVLPATQAAVGDFPPHGVDLEAMERALIEEALKRAGQNKSKAAKLLGLSRSKLYSRMERFGLA